MKFERVSAEEAFAYKIQRQDTKDAKKLSVVVDDFLSEQIVSAYKLLSSDDDQGRDPSYVIFIISLPKRIEMTFVPRYGNNQKKLSVFLLNPKTKMLAWVDKNLENYSEDLYEEKSDLKGNLELHFIGNESLWPFQDFLSFIYKMSPLKPDKKTEKPLKSEDQSDRAENSYGSYFGV